MEINNTIDHKCPACGAVLKFNPTGQNWSCEYCDSTFKLSDLGKNINKYNAKKAEIEKDQGEYNSYHCSNCGATIVTDLNTTATFCVYCKNTSIIKERLVGKFEPKFILPFHNTREDAIKAFKKVGKKHPLMPSSFSSPQNINEIRGIYIPFWVFTTESKGGIRCDCQKIKIWHQGNYQYTKTDTYKVIREGIIKFDKVPNDGSLKFDDAIMDSISPFDYQKLVTFSPSYLSGFLAEKYDQPSDQVQARVMERMKNTITNKLRESIKGYNTTIVKSNNISFEDINAEYVLLPIWLLNIVYKGKTYTFAMNGENGKMIGNMPVDPKKAIGYFLIISLVTFAICFLGFYLFVRSNV